MTALTPTRPFVKFASVASKKETWMILDEIGYPMVKAGIGDAYGAGFEYDTITRDRPNDLSHYVKHTRHAIGGGRYTDDTEMSTAVAEAMIEGRLTRVSLANQFVTAFHREQRKGYAGRFYDFLQGTKTGLDFLTNVHPVSDKSGAAMRGWVCGLYSTPEMVMEMAELQAKLTHNTPNGIKSAQAAALLTHFFAYDHGKKRIGRRSHLTDFITSYVPARWASPKTSKVGEKGMDSVHAAIQAVLMHDKSSLILKQCIEFQGDVDTVATIAMGAAAFSKDIEQDLPQNLFDDLEDGPWGKPYLIDLDNRLNAWYLKEKGE